MEQASRCTVHSCEPTRLSKPHVLDWTQPAPDDDDGRFQLELHVERLRHYLARGAAVGCIAAAEQTRARWLHTRIESLAAMRVQRDDHTERTAAATEAALEAEEQAYAAMMAAKARLLRSHDVAHVSRRSNPAGSPSELPPMPGS